MYRSVYIESENVLIRLGTQIGKKYLGKRRM